MLQLIFKGYIPAGYIEREFRTTDGKGYGKVFYKAYPHPDGITSYHAEGYRGRAIKPTWNYTFRSLQALEDYIKTFFNSIAEYQEYKKKKADEIKAFVPAIKPGDILDTCWGYDQTNREFFQVIRVTGKTAVLREIAQKEISSTGPFSGTVTGLRDNFLDKEKEISRRVLPGNSVKIDQCRYASLWDGQPAHCSWGG